MRGALHLARRFIEHTAWERRPGAVLSSPHAALSASAVSSSSPDEDFSTRDRISFWLALRAGLAR